MTIPDRTVTATGSPSKSSAPWWHRVSRGRLAAGMALIGLFTFVFRWLALDLFLNDHFDHVARARQVLLGDWPVRDFVDPGLPLMYLLSAAAHELVGAPILAEALLFASGFALAAALSFRAAARASGSLAVALFTVALQIAVYPRTYSYPKLLVYAIAITVGWWAVERLTITRLAGLAAATALAYYFRHDHGVYVAIGSLVLLAVHRWPQGPRRMVQTVAIYVGLASAFILPHLAYIQYHGGVVRYFGIGAHYSRAEVGVNPFRVARLTFESVSSDSVSLLFWVCWLIPVIGIVLLVRMHLAAPRMREDIPKIAMVIALAVAVNLGLVRLALATHLPDVAVPHTVLSAWLLATLWRWPVTWGGRLALRAMLVTGAIVCAAAVGLAFDARAHLLRTGLWLGPGEVILRLHERADELREESPSILPDTARQLAPFFEYMRRCTAEDDRFMYLGYQPEVFLLARRGFAGGHMSFYVEFSATPEDQAFTIERMRRESVPFILAPGEAAADLGELADIFRYVDANYRPMTSLDLDGGIVEVLVDQTRSPVSVDERTGWPCFTSYTISSTNPAT